MSCATTIPVTVGKIRTIRRHSGKILHLVNIFFVEVFYDISSQFSEASTTKSSIAETTIQAITTQTQTTIGNRHPESTIQAITTQTQTTIGHRHPETTSPTTHDQTTTAQGKCCIQFLVCIFLQRSFNTKFGYSSCLQITIKHLPSFYFVQY